MATIDEAGAALKTLLEYKAEIEQGYRDIDAGWNLEPESPDGQAIAIWSELLANLDEAVIAAYRSVDPNTAIGQQLDRICRLSGLTRQAATASTATVTFSGTTGTVVPAGTEVRHADTDTIWATDTDVELQAGEGSVGVTCQTLGPEPAGAGDLSIIATPVGGVSSVTNDAAASLGRAREADALLRRRRENSVAATGRNMVDSLFGSVANVDQVKHARVYENYTSSTDANGLAPHSVMVLADGGDTVEIAEAVANKKNPGTGMNAGQGFANRVQEDVETEQGSPFTATFFRPVAHALYVDITIIGALPAGAAEEIRQAVVDYARGELFDSAEGGFDRVGFTIGDLIPAGKFYTPVNRIVGANGYVSQITVGDTAAPSGSTFDPGFNGLAVFDPDRVSVAVS